MHREKGPGVEIRVRTWGGGGGGEGGRVEKMIKGRKEERSSFGKHTVKQLVAWL